MDKLKTYFKIFRRTLVLLWKSEKVLFCLLMFLSLVIGLAAPIKLSLWKEFIDYVTKMLGGSTEKLSGFIVCITMYFIVTITEIGVKELCNYVQTIFALHIDKGATRC